jgi:subtilisin family serine protease
MSHRCAIWLLIAVLALLIAPIIVSSSLRASKFTSEGTYLPMAHNSPRGTPTPAPPGGIVAPNDPLNYRQWPLQQIRAPEAWSITTGEPVVIALIDTGVDYNHPDLSERMTDRASWYDFVNRDTDPMDDHGRGTHVAGIAAAAGNNAIGITGLSWNARILPLKVLDARGTGSLWDVAEAIRYAADNGARVINLNVSITSDVTPPVSAMLEEAIRHARSAPRGAVLIAPAGDDHMRGNLWSYPAAMAGVVAVGATTANGGHARYSTTGPYLDVAAPGGDGYTGVYSTFPDSAYREMAGTSMAAPHVAGLAALILGLRPTLTPDEVAHIMRSTATDLGSYGWDPLYGHGLIDARRALEQAWYLDGRALAAQVEVAVSSQETLPAADCRLDHVQNHVLVRRSLEAHAAIRVALQNIPYRVVMEMTGWQLLEVPEGRACELVHALNDAGRGIVAELDLLVMTGQLREADSRAE